jgi:hypothetical protein
MAHTRSIRRDGIEVGQSAWRVFYTVFYNNDVAFRETFVFDHEPSAKDLEDAEKKLLGRLASMEAGVGVDERG